MSTVATSAEATSNVLEVLRGDDAPASRMNKIGHQMLDTPSSQASTVPSTPTVEFSLPGQQLSSSDESFDHDGSEKSNQEAVNLECKPRWVNAGTHGAEWIDEDGVTRDVTIGPGSHCSPPQNVSELEHKPSQVRALCKSMYGWETESEDMGDDEVDDDDDYYHEVSRIGANYVSNPRSKPPLPSMTWLASQLADDDDYDHEVSPIGANYVSNPRSKLPLPSMAWLASQLAQTPPPTTPEFEWKPDEWGTDSEDAGDEDEEEQQDLSNVSHLGPRPSMKWPEGQLSEAGPPLAMTWLERQLAYVRPMSPTMPHCSQNKSPPTISKSKDKLSRNNALFVQKCGYETDEEDKDDDAWEDSEDMGDYEVDGNGDYDEVSELRANYVSNPKAKPPLPSMTWLASQLAQTPPPTTPECEWKPDEWETDSEDAAEDDEETQEELSNVSHLGPRPSMALLESQLSEVGPRPVITCLEHQLASNRPKPIPRCSQKKSPPTIPRSRDKSCRIDVLSVEKCGHETDEEDKDDDALEDSEDMGADVVDDDDYNDDVSQIGASYVSNPCPKPPLPSMTWLASQHAQTPSKTTAEREWKPDEGQTDSADAGDDEGRARRVEF